MLGLQRPHCEFILRQKVGSFPHLKHKRAKLERRESYYWEISQVCQTFLTQW